MFADFAELKACFNHKSHFVSLSSHFSQVHQHFVKLGPFSNSPILSVFAVVLVDKPTPDQKPSKPAAPVVPPKKPVPPPGKGRPGILPPKRPDKPLAPSPSLKWVCLTLYRGVSAHDSSFFSHQLFLTVSHIYCTLIVYLASPCLLQAQWRGAFHATKVRLRAIIAQQTQNAVWWMGGEILRYGYVWLKSQVTLFI